MFLFLHRDFKRPQEIAVRRPLMEPIELWRMDNNNVIVLMSGCYPAYLKKVNWTELPGASEIERCKSSSAS